MIVPRPTPSTCCIHRSLAAIMALGLLLVAIFLIWLTVAEAIYVANFGYAAPASIRQFADEVFTTPAGWQLIIVGTSVGFLFAVLTLTISAVSFPLLLDRDVGAAVALLTSIRVVAANPVTMALWGLIVTATVGDRIGAVFPRPHGGVSGARSRDVASLSQGGRTEPRSPPGLSAATKEQPVRCGFPRRALPDAEVGERKVPDAQPGRTDSGASPSMTRGFLEAEVPEQ